MIELREGFPAALLRECLCACSNIKTLSLVAPSSTPGTIFTGVSFPRLERFRTDLPHGVLRSFLTAHPTISSLILGRCGQRTGCPLSGIPCQDIVDVRCPSSCLAGLSAGQVSSAGLMLTRTTSFPTLAINALSTSHVKFLYIDFYSNDCDVLQRVARAVPQVESLTLFEKQSKHVSFRSFSRRRDLIMLCSAATIPPATLGTTRIHGARRCRSFPPWRSSCYGHSPA